ncbi:MAG: hypothetical protein LBI53_08545 [Candidatus Peribacteria bacterium]|jgi:hypothetical protein|nr:hypothetical protein [Candidatus Peribacteria bacterium]
MERMERKEVNHKVSGKEMKAWIQRQGNAIRGMTIEQVSETFSGREFDELAMIEAGRILNICNYKIQKKAPKTSSTEALSNTPSSVNDYRAGREK